MRKLQWSALLIGVGFAVFAFTWSALPRRGGTPLEPMSRHAQAQLTPRRAPVSPATSQMHTPTHTTQVSLKKAFESSGDYWTFAESTLPAAQAGNVDAQFYLSRALERCNEDNRMYFQRRGQKLSLDEGLQFAVKRHLPIEVAQSVFDRCHRFQTDDSGKFGSAANWLAQATDGGQPLAEATTAQKILIQDMQHNFARAGGAVPDSSTTDEKLGNGVNPRELFRRAIQSRDPEVLFRIGDAQNLLDPTNSDTNTTRFAWWLVACQRGFDCSADSDWVKNSCAGDPQCASVSGPGDLVRILAGDRWPDVQQRAQEISTQLDAGQWTELGLDSSPGQASN